MKKLMQQPGENIVLYDLNFVSARVFSNVPGTPLSHTCQITGSLLYCVLILAQKTKFQKHIKLMTKFQSLTNLPVFRKEANIQKL
jgi:hypothetical protein